MKRPLGTGGPPPPTDRPRTFSPNPSARGGAGSEAPITPGARRSEGRSASSSRKAPLWLLSSWDGSSSSSSFFFPLPSPH